METKRPLPLRRSRETPPEEDERALLLLLSSASAQAPLPPVQALVHLHQHPPLPALSFASMPPPAPPVPVRPAARQRRILPRPSPLELMTSPVRPDTVDVGGDAVGTPPPSMPAAASPPRDSPPPRLPVSRSTSGVSTHSTASSCLSVAEMVAELTVARSRLDDADAATGAAVASPSPPDAQSRPPNKPAPAKKKRIRLKTERRREQCRANQARYRNKQRDHAVVLAERVEELRAEVRRLEQRSREQLGNSTAMRVVKEYFRVFQQGLAADEVAAPSTLSSAPARAPASRQQQLAFLESSMNPQLRLGWDVAGIDALVEQWRRYSQYHDDLVLELVSAWQVENVALDQSVGCMVHAAASLSVTITQETIAHVFPHLSSGVAPRITKKMVGARVTYPWSVIFEFDERGTVQRLTSSADFAGPLLSLLRNVEDVSEALEGAFVQHAWHLGDSA